MGRLNGSPLEAADKPSTPPYGKTASAQGDRQPQLQNREGDLQEETSQNTEKRTEAADTEFPPGAAAFGPKYTDTPEISRLL